MHAYVHTCMHTNTYIYQPIGIMVSVCLWFGRPEFNPRLSHTEDSKNATWCLLAKHSVL